MLTHQRAAGWERDEMNISQVLRQVTLAAAASLLVSLAAHAQRPQTNEPVPATTGYDMTIQEYQSLSCAVGGLAGGAAVYVYYEDIMAAVTSDPNPLLLLPLIAAGFSTACGMASALAPSFSWIYRHTIGTPRQQPVTQ